MSAPAIGLGISQIEPSNGNTWTSGVVGNADAAIDSGDLAVGSNPGIDPDNTTASFENANGPQSVGGQKLSAFSQGFAAVDLTSASSAIVVHFAGNPGQFNRVSSDPDGITFFAFSGVGQTDYAYSEIGGASDTFYKGAAQFYPILLRDSSRSGASAGFDPANITSIGVAWKAQDTGNFGVDFRIDQIISISNEVEFIEGDATTPGTFKAYRDLLFAESKQSFHSLLNQLLQPAVGFGHPVSVRSVNFNDSNFTFAFLASDVGAGFNVPSQGYYSLSIEPVANAIHSYTDGTFAYASGEYDCVINGELAQVLSFTRIAFLNTADVVISGSSVTMNNCTLSSPNSVDISGGLFNLTIDSCNTPVIVSGDLRADSIINITNPQAEALQIDLPPGDYRDLIFNVPTSVVNINPSLAGTYVLVGLNTDGQITLNNLTPNAITVEVAEGQNIAVGTGPITLSQPRPVNNASTIGLRSGSRIQVFNVTTNTEVYNDVRPDDWTLSYTEGEEFTSGDVVRVRCTYANGIDYSEPFETSAIAGAGGFSVLIDQQDWNVVESLGIDGSTVTEYTTDFINIQIDINDLDGQTTKSRLVAWYAYALYESALAIDQFFGGITVEDAANYRINTSQVNLKLENVSSLPVVFTDTGTRLYTDDGSTVLAGVGGSILMESGKVFAIETGVSGLTASESDQLSRAASVDGIFGHVVESGYTYEEIVRLLASESFGDSNVNTATREVTKADIGNTKTRITATIGSNGERSITSLDGT